MKTKIHEPPHIKAEELAFNVWLDLLDKLLDQEIPLSNAMVFAGQQLQQKQKDHGNQLFFAHDLYNALDSVNILLRRRPEYKQRTAGWSKETLPVDYD